MAEKNKTIQGYFDGVFWERNTLNEQKNISNKNRKKEKGPSLLNG